MQQQVVFASRKPEEIFVGNYCVQVALGKTGQVLQPAKPHSRTKLPSFVVLFLPEPCSPYIAIPGFFVLRVYSHHMVKARWITSIWDSFILLTLFNMILNTVFQKKIRLFVIGIQCDHFSHRFLPVCI